MFQEVTREATGPHCAERMALQQLEGYSHSQSYWRNVNSHQVMQVLSPTLYISFFEDDATLQTGAPLTRVSRAP